MEKLNNLNISLQSLSITMQWLKLFINAGETLLKIPNPTFELHPIHLFLSSLSSLSYIITANWSEGCMQSYKLLQLGLVRGSATSDFDVFWTEMFAFCAI